MDISFVTRKIQKSMASVSILALLTSLVSFTGIASADTFTDVSTSAWYYDYVDQISDASIMSGYDNGDFGPNDSLTRDQAAKVLVLAFDYPVDEDYDAGFSDVSSSNTLENYINTAALYDIVGGYTDADGVATGVFGSGDNIDRASFAKMVADAAGLDLVSTTGTFSDVSSSAWYGPYVETVYAWSIVDGKTSTTFAPGDSVSRAEAAKMSLMGIDPVWRETEEEPVTSDGDLTVEVSDESPDAMTIPSQATSVELAAWDFTANGGDVTLDSIAVHQYGITTLSTTHQVYLYDGNERLTSGKTISSSTNEATFTHLAYTVDEGDMATLTVRMDMGDYTSSGEVGLEIVSASKVDAGDAVVDGDFALQAAKHSISTTDSGTLTVQKNGSIVDAQVGEDGATISKFKLSAATEAAGVEELGLYLSGSVSTADVENFNLYVSGDDAEPIAQVDAVDSNDIIRFVIDGDFSGDSTECENSSGWCIAKGASKSFYVTADFNTGRTGDTVKVYIDQNTDVVAIGNLYGFGMTVDRDNADGYDGTATCDATASTDCSFSTLEGGDITISSNGPSASDIATNAKDATVLDFTIVSVTDVTFNSFPISMDATEAEATEGLLNALVSNFTDIKIMNTDTGAVLFDGVDSNVFVAIEAETDTIQETAVTGDGDEDPSFHLFTDDFSMSPGEELNLALTMDVANTSTLEGMTFTAAVNLGTTYPQLKDTNNQTLTNSSVLVPTSAVTSKTMTVRSPSLALSLASTPGIKTWVKGAQDVQFSGLVFACGDASDCSVTDITLQGYYDDEGNQNDYDTAYLAADHTITLNSIVGSVWLEDADGVEIAPAKTVSGTTFQVVFDAVNWDLDAGETAVAYVVGDITTTATTQDIAFGISSAANVVVEDADGTVFGATASGSTTGTVGAASVCTSSTDCTTAPASYVTTSAGGVLTVAVSGATPSENIIVAGSSDVEISRFTFDSTLEDFIVENLSLNNRQSAATTAAMGDYDDNVVGLTISYTNSDGDTETKAGTLTGGTAVFSGMDLFVDEASTSTMVVYADLNTISSGADAGTFVDLAVSYNNFRAEAQSSGDTYQGGNLDAGSANLAIGTITWTDGDQTINDPVTAIAAPSSAQTLVVDNAGAGTPANLPVGTLLCVSADTTCSGESIMVVTQWTEGTVWTDYDAGPPVVTGLGDTVSTIVIDNADTAFADADNIVYSLPGTGFNTGTKQMHVYGSKPTLALSASTPSGTGHNVVANDGAFIFSISANAVEKVQMRAGAAGDDEDDVAGGAAIDDADVSQTSAAGEVVDGTFAIEVTFDANSVDDNDCFVTNQAHTAGTMDDYAYVSFWINSSEVDVTYNALEAIFNDDLTCDTVPGGDDQIDFSAANTLVNGTALTAGTQIIGGGTADHWDLVTLTVSGTLAASTTFGFNVNATDGTTDFAATDQLRIDGIVFHNEYIVVDMSSNAIFTTNATSGLTADLVEEGTVVAQGGVGFINASSAKVVFVPGGLNTTDTYTTIEVAAADSKDYTVRLNTDTLLTQTQSVDDPLTFAITYGSAAGGTVTPGGFWWSAYASSAQTLVRWVGNTSISTLTSTVSY